MGRYLYLGKYTSTGLKGVLTEGGTAREVATRAAIESVGGQVHSYGFLQGEHDFYVLADMPDDGTAITPSLVAGSSGTVSVTSTRVFSATELDAICERARRMSFSPAGH
jgi:uncharacterized protein with GYD domain